MAIRKELKSRVASIEERTSRIVIDAPFGKVPSADIHRETVELDNDGKLVRSEPRKGGPLHISFADVREEYVEVGSVKITVGMIAAALPQFADRWAEAADKPKTVIDGQPVTAGDVLEMKAER